MKKIVIVVPKIDILKEGKEERKKRVQSMGSSMFTKIIPNKKKLSKKEQRQQNKKEVKNYDV